MSDTSHSNITGIRLYGKFVYRTFFGGGKGGVQLTANRALRMGRFCVMFFLSEMWNRAWLALDHILFPGFRSVDVRNPVFVCGVPRCGTTLLHRILAEDEDTTSFRLWEVMLAPSICQKVFFRTLGKIDRLFGGHVKRRIRNNFLKGAEEMRMYHPLDLWEAEEDDLILLPYVATGFLIFPFPYPDLVRPLIHFDDELAPVARRRVMKRYKAMVQRHLYVYGPNKRLLTKNPFMSSKVESIRETFPDARIICNVRTPYEAIPSTLSLFRFMAQFFRYDIAKTNFIPTVLDIVEYFYSHPAAVLPSWPDERHAFVRYPDLVADPSGTVEMLYGRLELPLSEAYRVRLDERARECRQYTSKHSYSLDDFGLTEEAIAERFAAAFAMFNFDPCLEAATPPQLAAPRRSAVG